MGTKKLTLVEYDMRRDLTAAVGKLEHVALPNKTTMEIVAELDEPLYDAIRKDPRWLQKLQDEAMKMARTEIKEIAQRMREADAKLAGKGKKEAEAEERKLDKQFSELCEEGGDVVARKAQKLLETYQASKKEWRSFKVRTIAKMTVTALTVVPILAVTAASGGTVTPLAIGGAVKAGISIFQDGAKLVTSTETLAKLIRADLKALNFFLTEAVEKEGAKIVANKSSGVRNAYEIGLNLVSKFTSLSTPSQKNCESKIQTHAENIEKLKIQLRTSSKKLYELMDTQEQWAKRLAKAKAIHTGYLLKRVEEGSAKAEKNLDQAINEIPKIESRIHDAEIENKAFARALAALKEGQSNRVKLVDDAISLLADIGSGMVDASSALERAHAAVAAVDQAVADLTLGSKKPG